MTLAAADAATHKALLAVERAARVKLSATVDQVALRVGRAIAGGHDPHAAAVTGSHLLENALATDLVTVRQAARRESGRTLELEMEAARVERLPLPKRTPTAHDQAAATMAAKSFAAAWMASVLVTLADGESPANAGPAAAAQRQAPKLETIAITEAARAFGEEREDITDAYAKEAKRSGLIIPLKRWSALLDACPRCAALHDKIVPWGISFPGGLVPGSAHPRCRCIESTIILPVPTKEAA